MHVAAEKFLRFNLDSKTRPDILARGITPTSNGVYVTSFSGKKWILELVNTKLSTKEKSNLKEYPRYSILRYDKKAKLYFSTICKVVSKTRWRLYRPYLLPAEKQREARDKMVKEHIPVGVYYLILLKQKNKMTPEFLIDHVFTASGDANHISSTWLMKKVPDLITVTHL